MEGFGSDTTQMRAWRDLGSMVEALEKKDIYEALSYTWNYVDQIVTSKGKNLETGKNVLPTKSRPRVRDNNWWLDNERKAMTFALPAPWDNIQSNFLRLK